MVSQRRGSAGRLGPLLRKALEPGVRLIGARLTGVMLTALMLLGSACSPNNGTSGFVVYSTWHTSSTNIDPFVGGAFLIYWIDEAAHGVSGIDYNGNGETDDDATFIINVQDGFGWYPGLAALEVVVLGNDVFLVADEDVENEDLNGDGDQTDLVLMHFEFLDGSVNPVDTLDPDTGAPYVLLAANKVWFTAEAPSLTGDQTSLRWVDVNTVFDPQEVPNQIGAGTLRPRLLSGFRDLPLLILDETLEAQNLNANGGLGTDVDMLDPYVLALVDLTDPTAPLVRNVEHALASKAAPTFVTSLGGAPADWLVTFLVSESDQGAEDLNDPALFDPAWVLPQCSAVADGDSTDQVQFFLELQSWLDGTTGVVNTGLAGTDRALSISGYVGTLSDEVDAGCDLNQDGDTSDTVFRWTSIADPIVPPPMLPLHAIALLPDESSGAAPLASAFLIAVDELADGSDHNGDGLLDDVLLAQNEPGMASVWTFDLFDPKTGTRTVGVDRMASHSNISTPNLLPTSLLEEEQGQNLNLACLADNDDGDMIDGLPAWGRWDAGLQGLVVPGLPFAAQTGNSGLVMYGGLLYFRLSEAEHGDDVNGDGDETDMILYRASPTTCNPVLMGDANDLPGDIVFTTDLALGACFYGDETISEEDYNRDGDILDIVVRWFRY